MEAWLSPRKRLNNEGNENDITMEEVVGETTFVHVGGSPSYFIMPFVVHESVMGKETLAKLLDENFKVEMPMVIG